MSKILISAGDYSADIHGECLVKELKSLNPSIEIVALGGTKLKNTADEFLYDMVGLDVSGFSQPVKQFFRLKKILQGLLFPMLESKKISAVVLIDYYGFNIHIAEKAKKLGIPVYYFVCPQIWASRMGRIKKIKKFVSKMLVIFPFEENLYKKHSIPVEYVGHPLVDPISQVKTIQPYAASLKNGKFKIGLMPGSRLRELIYHLPVLLASLIELKHRFPNLEALLFQVDSIPETVYQRMIQAHLPKGESLSGLRFIRESNYSARSELALSLTASGTATLENALLGIPMVVIYKTSWLTYWIAKQVIRVPYISMPNILLGKETIPELVQNRASVKEIVLKTSELIANPSLLEHMHEELIELKNQLGPPGAYRRAAKIILESL